MPTRLCSEPTCPEVAVYRGRCTLHARSNERTIKRAGLRIYSTAKWNNTRRAVLFAQPLCACGCGAIATDVDHIIPLDEGGDPWARSNLQGLAASCHGRKTRSEQHGPAAPTQQGGAAWPRTPSPATH
jgi:5-methylcytosine-specific restriction endonuclease McrA